MRFIKVYRDSKSAPKIEGAKVIATYPAFVVVEADEPAARALSKDYLVEDITEQYEISVAGNSLPTELPRITAAGMTLAHPAYSQADELDHGPHHYIVQFKGPIKNSWLREIAKAGGEVVAPYQGFAVIARLDGSAAGKVAASSSVRWIGHLPYEARLSRHALRSAGGSAQPDPKTPRTRYRDDTYTVQFFADDLAAAGKRDVEQAGFKILEAAVGARTLIVRPKADDPDKVQSGLEALSRVHGVEMVTARPIRRTSNDHAATIMATSVSMSPPPGLGLSGNGEVIGVCDTGLDTGNAATIHLDFRGRIKALKSYPISAGWKLDVKNPGADDGPADLGSGHGTHTSGSAVANGASSAALAGISGPVRGLSHRAQLVFQAVEQEINWKNPAHQSKYGRYMLAGLPADLTPLFAFAYGKGVRIHSNSWGGGDPGQYDDYCRQVDAFVWSKPDFCILFAAGNDGRDGDGSGTIDEGSVTPPGTAKNCITVGASENLRPEQTLTYGGGWPQDYPAEPLFSDRLADNAEQVAGFSSRGPTLDNRIKPDVVAPGTWVLSTRSQLLAENNYGYGRFGSSKMYMYDSGTSMATPLTAGAVGLVREYLRTRQGIASPSAALLKATLIAGAAPMGGGTVPDNHQGFGRVSLDRVLAPASPLKARFVEGTPVATGTFKQFSVTVGVAGRPLKIVLAYTDFPGPALVNNLNLVVTAPGGGTHVGNGGSGGSFDSTNNVEMISIPSAPAGAYMIRVVGSNVPRGPQRFALAIVGA